jgi:small-conductance mechanosensitive channel
MKSLSLWGIEFTAVDILIKIALPLAAAFGLYKLILFFARKLVYKRVRLDEEDREKILSTLRFILRVIFLVTVIGLILNFLGPGIIRFASMVWTVLTTPFVTAGDTSISIVTILLTLPVFYIAAWVSRLVKRFTDSSILQKLTMGEGTKFTISILIKNAVLIVSVLIGFSMIGINLSSLIIVFGALGIGIGFGLQGVVADFISGFVLIFERPIKEGDRIQVGEMEGDVIQIRLRSAVINTLTNETIVVPNSKLVTDTIHNYSYIDRRIIVRNKVQVHYQSDLQKVRDVLLSVNKDNPFSLADPVPEAWVLEFQDSGILVELRTWIAKATNKYQALTWINFNIWKRFKEEGIRIPYPQRDLYLKELPQRASQLFETK